MRMFGVYSSLCNGADTCPGSVPINKNRVLSFIVKVVSGVAILGIISYVLAYPLVARYLSPHYEAARVAYAPLRRLANASPHVMAGVVWWSERLDCEQEVMDEFMFDEFTINPIIVR